MLKDDNDVDYSSNSVTTATQTFGTIPYVMRMICVGDGRVALDVGARGIIANVFQNLRMCADAEFFMTVVV